jgi:DedD protein
MGLLSYFKRKSEAPAAAIPPAEMDGVAAARTLARRRLIGATVLLGIGVVGFPLLFETQPRPIAIDIPIEIPRKDGAPALVLPPAVTAPAAAPAAKVASVPAEIVERSADEGRELAASAPALKPSAKSTPKPASAASLVPAKPLPSAPKPADDGGRARALLDGETSASSAPSAPSARVVVQVGAFADAGKLAEVRHKLEKLGLKTYTQVVEVEGSKRTRVRVGPFDNRAEADKAAARIRAAGLPAAILTL